jgi:Tfp pilus assembly protein PilF
MKLYLWLGVFGLALLVAACGPAIDEVPLEVAGGGEPSSRLHNSRGRQFFEEGKYFDALLGFKQARTADPYSGEIHFNMALTLHLRGEEDRAREEFALARKYAQGNTAILQSPLLNKYLGSAGE